MTATALPTTWIRMPMVMVSRTRWKDCSFRESTSQRCFVDGEAGDSGIARAGTARASLAVGDGARGVSHQARAVDVRDADARTARAATAMPATAAEPAVAARTTGG